MACHPSPLLDAYGPSGSDVQSRLCGPLLDAYGHPGQDTQQLLNSAGHDGLAYTGFPVGIVVAVGLVLILIALVTYRLGK